MLSRFEHWTPPPLYAGQDVFVIGGGPSFRGFDTSRFIGRHVIAINSSAYSCRHLGATLFFADHTWIKPRQRFVASWDGLVVTDTWDSKLLCSRALYIEPVPNAPDFFVGESRIKSSPSCGHNAISLAICASARRVILLGYDMRPGSHHDDYEEDTPASIYTNDFIPAFAGWDAAAKRVGVDIVNATPGSALKEFRKMGVDAFLRK